MPTVIAIVQCNLKETVYNYHKQIYIYILATPLPQDKKVNKLCNKTEVKLNVNLIIRLIF